MQFFSEIFNQIFFPKMGDFGFFQLIEIYARTILLIDKENTSEASYTARQSLRRVKSPETCAICLKFVYKQKIWVLYSENHIY